MQLVVGRIGRAHGVRGDLFIEVRTDEPELRFAVGSSVLTSDGKTLRIAMTKWHSGRMLAHFEGYDDRTIAETLRNLDLSVDVDPLDLPNDPDEFYDHQLIGLRALLEDGSLVGTISEVIHLPSQDMFAIKRDGLPEAFVPFVVEIVPEVDIEKGIIMLTPPPGLLNEADAIIVEDSGSDADGDSGSDA